MTDEVGRVTAPHRTVRRLMVPLGPEPGETTLPVNAGSLVCPVYAPDGPFELECVVHLSQKMAGLVFEFVLATDAIHRKIEMFPPHAKLFARDSEMYPRPRFRTHPGALVLLTFHIKLALVFEAAVCWEAAGDPTAALVQRRLKGN